MQQLDDDAPRYAWDRDAEPALRVAPGDVVTLRLRDASDGQLTRSSTAADVADLDPARANPLTGPVAVDGARAGDTLVLTIEDVAVDDWGWSALIPGFGLLADDFPEPHLVHATVDDALTHLGGTGLAVRTRPFVGTIGVAPPDPGAHPTIPPLPTGGNLDCRDVRPGAALHLPVAADDALLSAGDAHAAQGDGEVCGTAVEVAATLTVRVDLGSDVGLRAPQLEVPADPSPAAPTYATLGVGPDLHGAARDATRAMVTWLVDHHDLPAPDAYVLCSVAAHLRIREVVDAPNWVVSLDLPLDVLAG